MRTRKSDTDKELRKLWKEYTDSWSSRRESGQYVDVEPYQSGWIRYFVLRDDIKNRADVRYIRQALDLINYTVSCRREDFTYKNAKGIYKPIEQKIHTITEEKWKSLSPNVKKLFVKVQCMNRWSKHIYFVYAFKFDWYFEFKIEPRIITKQWLPDPEWETHIAEIEHKIQRENLWPKINRMLGVPSSYEQDYNLPLIKSRQAFNINEHDLTDSGEISFEV